MLGGGGEGARWTGRVDMYHVQVVVVGQNQGWC